LCSKSSIKKVCSFPDASIQASCLNLNSTSFANHCGSCFDHTTSSSTNCPRLASKSCGSISATKKTCQKTRSSNRILEQRQSKCTSKPSAYYSSMDLLAKKAAAKCKV
jgi:hypothetical protein